MKYTLKAIRTNAGLTQEEACKKLGICLNTLINYETGKRYPNALTIKKIEEVYGVNYDEIDFLYSKNTVKQ